MSDQPANFPFNRSSPARFWALVPCAGIGSRADSNGPKQYQPLAGQPMVMHTLAAFAGVTRLTNIAVVVAADDDFFESMETNYLMVACGGSTRAGSVFNGLKFLDRKSV